MSTTSCLPLLLTALIYFVLTPSYANIDYSVERPAPPVKKEKPRKKKPSVREGTAKKWVWSFRPPSTPSSASAQEDIGTSIVIVLFIALFLAVPILFLIGGITGGLGWFIGGAIVTALWLLWSALLAFLDAPYIFVLGIITFLFLSLLFLGFFIWALVAALPTLLIFSSILGGLSLIGLLVALFRW